MNIFQELKELGKSILIWFYVFLVLAVIAFTIGLKEVSLFGRDILFPLPTINSFSAKFFEIIQNDLLPQGVDLIVTNPLSAFLAQISVSVFLAFTISFPFLLYRIIGYISPALYNKEKKAFLKILFPSFFLFIIGSLFAYFILIPPTFKILYSYTSAMGAIPFFSVREFVSSVFVLIFVVGILFLLPIFMLLLTKLGIIKADFWKKNWRYAILTFLIFSAVITPDGTGITMLILSLPLIALYFTGMIISRRG